MRCRFARRPAGARRGCRRPVDATVCCATRSAARAGRFIVTPPKIARRGPREIQLIHPAAVLAAFRTRRTRRSGRGAPAPSMPFGPRRSAAWLRHSARWPIQPAGRLPMRLGVPVALPAEGQISPVPAPACPPPIVAYACGGGRCRALGEMNNSCIAQGDRLSWPRRVDFERRVMDAS